MVFRARGLEGEWGDSIILELLEKQEYLGLEEEKAEKEEKTINHREEGY